MGIGENNTNYKSFPLEKILTISAREYFDISGKNLINYEVHGVHCDEFNYWGNPTERFAEFVPEDTEVVVDYKINRSLGEYEEVEQGRNARGVQFTAHGTALIPKRDLIPKGKNKE